MPGPKIVYWDSCVYITFLKGGEQRDEVDINAMKDMATRLRRREITLLASVLVLTEVLDAHLPAGVDRMFEDIFNLDNVEKVNVDAPIARLAHDLRNHYIVNGEEFGGKTLTTPDAIHLATAIIRRASEFHTFDAGGRGNSIGLLRLGNNVAGHSLKVCTPGRGDYEPRLL